MSCFLDNSSKNTVKLTNRRSNNAYFKFTIMSAVMWLHLIFYAAFLTSVTALSAESSISVRLDALRQRLRQLVLSPTSSSEIGVASRSSNGVILIDGDNVRGKTKFRLSKEELTDRVQRWIASSSLSGLVVLMFDHGSKHSSFFIPDSSLAVVFSGPGRTADDVITRDVGWFQAKQQDVVVVTEDNGLKRRCRTSLKGRASARGKKTKTKGEVSNRPTHDLTFVGSPLFAEMILAMWPLDLPAAGDAQPATPVARPLFGASPSGTLESVGSKYNPEVVLMRREVDLRRQLSGIQTALSRCNRKAAVKLRLREAEVKKRLGVVATAVRDVQSVAGAREGEAAVSAYGSSEASQDRVNMLASGLAGGSAAATDESVSGDGTGGAEEGAVGAVGAKGSAEGNAEGNAVCEGPGVVDRGSALLAKLLANGRPPGTVEETWERIILAEQLRHSLQLRYGNSVAISAATTDAVAADSTSPSYSAFLAGTGSAASPSPCLTQQYVHYINRNFATVAKCVASVVKGD